MSRYHLQPDEIVLARADHASQEVGRRYVSVELLLTNLHVVATQRGLFGAVKSIMVYRLDQVKIFRDRAQAVAEARDRHDGRMRVYFYQGEETFRLQDRREAKMWAEKINEVLTGAPPSINSTFGDALPGADVVADVLKDTVGIFKERLGIGASGKGQQQRASNCRGCGASIVGYDGRVATCSYCGTAQQV